MNKVGVGMDFKKQQQKIKEVTEKFAPVKSALKDDLDAAFQLYNEYQREYDNLKLDEERAMYDGKTQGEKMSELGGNGMIEVQHDKDTIVTVEGYRLVIIYQTETNYFHFYGDSYIGGDRFELYISKAGSNNSRKYQFYNVPKKYNKEMLHLLSVADCYKVFQRNR